MYLHFFGKVHSTHSFSHFVVVTYILRTVVSPLKFCLRARFSYVYVTCLGQTFGIWFNAKSTKEYCNFIHFIVRPLARMIKKNAAKILLERNQKPCSQIQIYIQLQNTFKQYDKDIEATGKTYHSVYVQYYNVLDRNLLNTNDHSHIWHHSNTVSIKQ